MKTLLFLALILMISSCAPNDDCICTMPMTNNPNVINVRQQNAMPGMNM